MKVRQKYVPKGGHLVDFEKRVTPKLKRLLSKEQDQEQRRHQESINTPIRVDADAHFDVHRQTSPCMAMVVWSGSDVGDHKTQNKTQPDAKLKQLGKPGTLSPKASSWKPPGCLKTPLWKRPVHTKKTKEKKTVPQQAVNTPCASCRELEAQKENIRIAKQDVEEKQKQLHLRTINVESLMSKCSRERKEFETYKENELKHIQNLKESIKMKKKRDALACASETRGSLQHTEIARLRIQIEESEASLKIQKAKMKTDVQKHAQDIERYRERQKDLEEEIRLLRNSLATMSTKQHTRDKSALQSPSTPQDMLECSTPLEKEKPKVIHHDNNTVEKQWMDGTTQFLYENGDIRQSWGPCVLFQGWQKRVS